MLCRESNTREIRKKYVDRRLGTLDKERPLNQKILEFQAVFLPFQIEGDLLTR